MPQVASFEITVGRQSVRITRPDKVLFPQDGITKRELAEYYQQIASVMLPYLRGRPIAMERYPDGIRGERIFQKAAARYFPAWVKTALMKKQGGTVRHVICDDAATLVYLANQASITPHVWLSRSDKPQCPDHMIFDLDPSGDDFSAVCRTALKLRELLEHDGLRAFVKTTGSRGLHVLVPLDRRVDFDDVRTFARAVAKRLVATDPEHLTMDIRKGKRGGRIFIDTARNAYAQTAAPPYAVRPRDGAPVAAPLEWRELEDPKLRPDTYTIRNIFKRLESLGDVWKGVTSGASSLPKAKLAAS